MNGALDASSRRVISSSLAMGPYQVLDVDAGDCHMLHTYWLQTSEHSVNQQPDHQVKPSSYWGNYQKIDLRRQMMSCAARQCWMLEQSIKVRPSSC
jgi:hypothetical protein